MSDLQSSTRSSEAEPLDDDQTPQTKKPEIIIPGAHGGTSALRVGDVGAQQRRRKTPPFLNAFLPNRAVSKSTMLTIIAVEVAIALLIWVRTPFAVLPNPGEVFASLGELWAKQGLGQELATSFGLNVQALLWASLISLLLSYLTVIPVFRPLVAAISKGRFLSLAGFTLIFTLMVGGGRPLKLSLLVFTITVFYITSMASVIAAIPRGEFDHARTLRMSEWRVVWEVVILGTAEKAFEVLRQNAAIGWMMLTMVEGIVRGEGGIGNMLLNTNKQVRLSEVFAIQIVILLVGLFQDYIIGALRRIVCPYADLTMERK